MDGLEILLQNRWILKSKDKEKYYQLRDELDEIRKFATEKMGCQIIENSLLVKMEKIPAIPEGFMGIEEFTSNTEYVFFCILLMFLEDKEVEEQFVLSQLTEYIQGNAAELDETKAGIDWTIYSVRCKLIRVLKYAVDQGILLVTDGSEDGFRDGAEGEVLYENTGTSRYFMRNFQRDVMEYNSIEDFCESEWINVDQDRGMVRRHRVYKRILFLPGMYKRNGAEDDFEYLKYYGRRLSEDIEQQFNGQVHIHKGSAYFLAGEDCRVGTMFPGTGGIANIILLCCKAIRSRIESGAWNVEQDETVEVDKIEVEQLIRKLKNQYDDGFGKELRVMAEGKFIQIVLAELQRWTFIDVKGLKVTIYPLCGKLVGDYPNDYKEGLERNKGRTKDEE